MPIAEICLLQQRYGWAGSAGRRIEVCLREEDSISQLCGQMYAALIGRRLGWDLATLMEKTIEAMKASPSAPHGEDTEIQE